MAGSFQNGGRYNVAGLFGALYLGFDHETCQSEVSSGIVANVPLKKGVFSAWEYSVSLQQVISLTDAAILAKLALTRDEITRPYDHWTASGIGEHLHKRGDVEALEAPSAHLETGRCLDIFLDRLQEPSIVRPIEMVGTWPD